MCAAYTSVPLHTYAEMPAWHRILYISFSHFISEFVENTHTNTLFIHTYIKHSFVRIFRLHAAAIHSCVYIFLISAFECGRLHTTAEQQQVSTTAVVAAAAVKTAIWGGVGKFSSVVKRIWRRVKGFYIWSPLCHTFYYSIIISSSYYYTIAIHNIHNIIQQQLL